MRFPILYLIAFLSALPLGIGQGIAPRTFFNYSITLQHKPEPRTARIFPLNNALPAYPGDMLPAGMNGQATVKLIIKEDGTVSDVRVDATHDAFAESTKRAVANWSFHPPKTLDAKTPVSVSLTCIITFTLADD